MGKGQSMRFEDFAYDHGLLIDSLTMDKWTRVKTVDKPTKMNGAYVFDGHGGAVINFATMDKHAIYKSDKPYVIDHAKIKQLAVERENRQEEARKKAVYIVKSGQLAGHPYLEKKGFFERGLVWTVGCHDEDRRSVGWLSVNRHRWPKAVFVRADHQGRESGHRQQRAGYLGGRVCDWPVSSSGIKTAESKVSDSHLFFGLKHGRGSQGSRKSVGCCR